MKVTEITELRALSDAEGRLWLEDRLRGAGSSSFERGGYRSGASLLLYEMGTSKDLEVARKVGDWTLSILREGLLAQRFDRDAAGLELLGDLLFLLEGLPVSEESVAAHTLLAIRASSLFRGRSTQSGQDLHTLTLLALANHAPGLSHERRTLFVEDLAIEALNPDYSLAALSVLSRIDKDWVTEQLPRLVPALERAGISAANFLFLITQEDEVPEEQREDELDDQPMSTAVALRTQNESSNALDDLLAQRVHPDLPGALRQSSPSALVVKTVLDSKTYSEFLFQRLQAEGEGIVERWAMEEPSLVRSQLRFFLSQFNGFKGERIGRELGSSYARAQTKRAGMEENVLSFWRILNETSTSEEERRDRLLLPAHFVRGWCETSARTAWHLDPADLRQLSYRYIPIMDRAQRAKETGRRRNIDKVKVAQSQFHEDRLFNYFLQETQEEAEGLWIKALPSRYGTLEVGAQQPVDVALINELSQSKSERKRSKAIFYHRGYFVFSRREWLVELRRRNVPEVVEQALDALMEGVPLQEIDLGARCWIALEGGLEPETRVEFSRLYQALARGARQVGGKEDEQRRLRSRPSGAASSFDFMFEDFVTGETKIFLGGSVHSRLLMRWWGRIGAVLTLLEARDFEYLFKEDIWPPANRLVFGPKLRGYHLKDFRHAIGDFYEAVAGLLSMVGGDLSEDSNRLLRGFMAILAEKEEAEGSCWTFVSHEDDMRKLLSEDDHYLNQAGAEN